MNNSETRIVEVVGPAGAGKTTLCLALRRKSETIFPGNFPDVRKVSDAPFFLWNGLKTVHFLIHLSKARSRKLTRSEFAWLSILYGWPKVLQKALKRHPVIVMDQGPIYLLTETHEFGPEYLREHRAEKFWLEVYVRWADTVDMIVWLDAADTDLLNRIRSRDKGHVVKNETDEAAFAFIARYRLAYQRTISKLSTNQKKPRLLPYNTSQNSTEEIADQLLLALASSKR